MTSECVHARVCRVRKFWFNERSMGERTEERYVYRTLFISFAIQLMIGGKLVSGVLQLYALPIHRWNSKWMFVPHCAIYIVRRNQPINYCQMNRSANCWRNIYAKLFESVVLRRVTTTMRLKWKNQRRPNYVLCELPSRAYRPWHIWFLCSRLK